ncbi:xanthine dehydrogenase family protein molybdopterin-binding subunit [Salaquimonas pukyongi]|uniref:xanthine dehydrogenase family protein molybdopterin-binding subunit n=1 Tax=Salaquimonas pukyongi TaxID=2712698 RepID=UPI00096BAAB3|nr:xanthine dehydrogenase family protein molybdopterin-binding subunit [Salaquimonas pukyongi]
MNETVHAKFGMGASVLRTEDDAFATGQGRYTDDIKAEGMLHGYVLRSPHAHARFTITDTSAARQADGVHLILTAADIAHLKPLSNVTPIRNEDGSEIVNRDLPVLCDGIVRHVGDAIAFIVADSTAEARDAAELIEVDFEDLDVVIDTEGALDEDAPLVYPQAGTNLAFTTFLGDREKTAELFSKAARVSELRIVNSRLVCNYMEVRSCLSQWSEAEGYTVTVCSQGAHGIRRHLAAITGEDAGRIRVITPDVGGGFGTKVFPYREYPLTMEAAKRLGRPVKWTSDRSEHFVADAHGRDNIAYARMAMDENGRFLAVEVDLIAAMGAYLHCYGPYIPWLGMTMTTGIYDIPAMAVTCRGTYTNTTPLDAYRGAGRPEAAYLIERLVEQCAQDMGMTPDEIRNRNFIRPDQLPYKTPGGRLYDTGEFAEHMKLCMERAGWNGFDKRNEEAGKRGRFRGIGMSTYIEACAFAGSEPAFLTLEDDGTILIRIGTQSNGQGHATAYSQLAAEKFGMGVENFRVHQGDTAVLEKGGGTGGSRSVPLGGISVARAADALAEKVRKVAAGELEASPGDIELSEGEARIIGTDRTISLAAIAKAASESDRNASAEYTQDEATYPNGTHVCEVEIDPETGSIEVVAYTIVDDFGATVNPLLLAGQIHGGVVQGIGQCLNERVVYDEDGQLLTASFMDYSMPRAAEIPNFHFETRNVPSTTNAMGIKGAGEAGTIGACPAVMNAVNDALRRKYDAAPIDMPVVPHLLWEAIEAARTGA